MMQYLTILFLSSLAVSAQGRQPLQGKVVVNDIALHGAFIINKQTGTEVKTDASGNFGIEAKAGDRLVVYSNATQVREFYISADTFTNMPYTVAVEYKATQLDEVVVEAPTITSESLGLVPENQKRYTVAERRLRQADSGPVDILLNWISGRKKRLKRELATERKVMALDELNGLLNEDEIAAEYGIPAERVEAFLFYAIEEPRIVAALKEGNDRLVEMLIIEAAASYLALEEEAQEQPQSQPQSQSQSQSQLQQESGSGSVHQPTTGNQQPGTNNPLPQTKQ